MGTERCVFCEILEGEAPARWVARDANAVAFLPLPEGALAPGHTLVVSARHVVGVQDAEPADLADAMTLVHRLSVAMQSVLGATGVNVLNASGPGSEQSVQHLHFHVVPRRPDDGFSTWPAGRSRLSTDAALPEALAAAMR
ncbi:HIT domain-containing protein [uncultured Nocardioides sp.]|uniref:HIT family protein n=1 Tax=uncultured Nocardioides sp. TaxID=198441 RepID=UPI003455A174